MSWKRSSYAVSLACFLWVCDAFCAETPPRPNVLLISLDTFRADHLHHAPYLMELAQEGRSFPNTWANSNWTLPSHVSLLTGAPLMHHQTPPVDGLPPFDGLTISPEFPTLAEMLSRAGYATGGCTEGGSSSAYYGFDRGFDHYLDPKHANGERAPLLSCAEKVLSDASGRPFFLFLHTYVVHDYFTNSSDYHDFVDPKRDADQIAHGSYLNKLQALNPPEQYVRRLYAAGVRRGDEFTRSAIARVRELSKDAPLLVIVTSDHGESLGERDGVWLHGDRLFEEQLRIPLIIWGNFKGAPHGRLEAPTSSIDIAPSTLEFLKLPLPESFAGMSDRFLPSPNEERSDPVLASVHHPSRSPRRRFIEQVLIADRLKYLRSDRFNGRTMLEECTELEGHLAAQNNLVGAAPCAKFPAVLAHLLRRFSTGLMVASDVPVALKVSPGSSLLAARSGSSSAVRLVKFKTGELNWQPLDLQDNLSLLMRVKPNSVEVNRIGDDSQVRKATAEELSDAVRPLEIRVEQANGSRATLKLFARIPDSAPDATKKDLSDEEIERLRALGYLVE
jgi:arylsulfatase A-like enzyme